MIMQALFIRGDVMAGIGAAPKIGPRHGHGGPPRRGEWIDLPNQTAKPPALPRGTWSARTKAVWLSWWTDPASTQWTQADKGAVIELAYVHAELVAGRISVAPEIRLRMDLLGLSQKGKRDLRWRIPTVPVVEQTGNVTAIDKYKAMLDA